MYNQGIARRQELNLTTLCPYPTTTMPLDPWKTFPALWVPRKSPPAAFPTKYRFVRTLQASLYLRYFMLPDQSVPFGYLIHARLNVQLTIFSHGILFFHQLLLVFVCVGMVLSHSVS